MSILKLDLTVFPHLSNESTRHLIDVLNKVGVPARFVGGCIRDALLNIQAHDIDLAVPIPPEETVRILRESGIKVIPTGIKYGTVTAIVDKSHYEITTLREDWDSAGRHTEVSYGTDWETDAERRDFTFNALYADSDGTLYDYFGGIDDLKAGRVRFIGDPEQRIEEDYLRILRFFRFYAWYGRGGLDSAALAACEKLKDGLKKLSRERIRHEFLKTLAAPNPLPALLGMESAGVLPYVLSEDINLDTLVVLISLEEICQVPSSALRRLVAILVGALSSDLFPALTEELKLSRHERAYLDHCFEKFFSDLNKSMVEQLYYDGPMLYVSLTLLRAAVFLKVDLSEKSPILESDQNQINNILLSDYNEIVIKTQKALSCTQGWEKPLFPLKGADLLFMGISPGPQIGELLKACETWWVKQGFRPTKEECLGWVKQEIS